MRKSLHLLLSAGSQAKVVSWRSYAMLCRLIDTCLLSTEINSTKFKAYFHLVERQLTRFRQASLVAGTTSRLQKTLEWHLEEL